MATLNTFDTWSTEGETQSSDLSSLLTGAFEGGSVDVIKVEEFLQLQLQQFAADPDFEAKMTLAFGENDYSDWQSQFSEGSIQNIPIIQILPAETLQGANAAYAGSTNTIYFSDNFLNQYSDQPEIIGSVLLEEFGHSIDWKANKGVDTPGDEGYIFSSLVQGIQLSQSELEVAKSENDSINIENYATTNSEVVTGLEGNSISQYNWGQFETLYKAILESRPKTQVVFINGIYTADFDDALLDLDSKIYIADDPNLSNNPQEIGNLGADSIDFIGVHNPSIYSDSSPIYDKLGDVKNLYLDAYTTIKKELFDKAIDNFNGAKSESNFNGYLMAYIASKDPYFLGDSPYLLTETDLTNLENKGFDVNLESSLISLDLSNLSSFLVNYGEIDSLYDRLFSELSLEQNAPNDLLESLAQFLLDEPSKLSQDINSGWVEKIISHLIGSDLDSAIVLAHSQGNFFVEDALLEILNSVSNTEMLKIVGLGSPTNYVSIFDSDLLSLYSRQGDPIIDLQLGDDRSFLNKIETFLGLIPYLVNDSKIAVNLGINHSLGGYLEDSKTDIANLFYDLNPTGYYFPNGFYPVVTTEFGDWINGYHSPTSVLRGEGGNDVIIGDSSITGYKLIGGSGWDVLYGGEGYRDEASYEDNNDGQGIIVHQIENYLDTGLDVYEVNDGYGSFDVLTHIEKISGSKYVDEFYGGRETDKFYGRDGDDYFNGFGGNDFLYGGDGRDTIIGGSGDDLIEGDSGSDNLYGSDGWDKIYGGSGNDYIEGGSGRDRLHGEDDNDTIYGGTENDFIEGGGGKDEIYGGSGDDEIHGNVWWWKWDWADDIEKENGPNQGDNPESSASEASFEIAGLSLLAEANFRDFSNSENFSSIILLAEANLQPDGDDIIYGGAGNDIINGDIGNDTIYGEDDNDIIYGGFGNDFIYGGTGDDKLNGAEGNDFVSGGDGADYLFGKEGDDLLNGDAGNDNLYGGDGQDNLNGGDGNDLLRGALGDDFLHGDAGNDHLEGNEGNDLIYGDSGNDRIYGGIGSDRISGGDDNDEIYGGDGADLVQGDRGDDLISGGTGDDILSGNEGNDTIYGDAGKDLLHGNEGDDFISGGLDDDLIYGDIGNDELLGDEGQDKLYGGDGADSIAGGADDDLLYGEAGDDYMEGNDGADQIAGGDGADEIYGGAGDDFINGQTGNDKLYGDDGNDLIYGEEGDDQIYGGNGDDRMIGGAGGDRLDGGNGNDIISYYTSDKGVYIHLQPGRASGGDAQGDRIYNVENVEGSYHDDTLIGDNGNNTLIGLDGDDELDGKAGDDELYGGNGDDYLEGRQGNDLMVGGNGDDYIDGGSGDDSIVGGAGNDTLYGGRSGNDIFSAGAGDDYINASSGNDIIYAGAGNDTIDAGSHDDIVAGGAGNDLIEAGSGDDWVHGGRGSDLIEAGSGDDWVHGGRGNDILRGHTGNDTLIGGAGNDILEAHAGDNLLVGGFHDDILYGGSEAGTDTFVLSQGWGIETIFNFDIAHDILGLFDDLTAQAIQFTKGTGANSKDILVELAATGETLAILKDVKWEKHLQPSMIAIAELPVTLGADPLAGVSEPPAPPILGGSEMFPGPLEPAQPVPVPTIG